MQDVFGNWLIGTYYDATSLLHGQLTETCLLLTQKKIKPFKENGWKRSVQQHKQFTISSVSILCYANVWLPCSLGYHKALAMAAYLATSLF